VEKVEGLAVLDDHTIAVINDNDFTVGDVTLDVDTGTFVRNSAPEPILLGLVRTDAMAACPDRTIAFTPTKSRVRATDEVRRRLSPAVRFVVEVVTGRDTRVWLRGRFGRFCLTPHRRGSKVRSRQTIAIRSYGAGGRRSAPVRRPN
jgi:hypothetical protein